MASLIEIRKRIDSVGKTSKITKAMQLVAGAKMRQFQKKALASRSYVWDLLAMLRDQVAGNADTLFTEKREKGDTLFVLYTSDKGLCGPLNNQLIRRLFKSEKWIKTPKDERILITIGRKSFEYARVNKIPVEKHFKGVPEKLTIVQALPIIDAILKYWIEGKCKEVLFVTPHYKNTFTSYPVLKTFLPFSEEMVQSNIGHAKELPPAKKFANMIFEPSEERFKEALFSQIIQTMFIESFFELRASEYSSRMIAMQNATDAAHKMINGLRLVYNKTRQQVITQEIAELIGGSEAVSG